MPKLRNPGPWSFAIFALAAALVAFLNYRGVPDSVKLAGQLITLAVAAFGARSALARPDAPTPPGTSASSRPPMPTWGELTPHDPNVVDVEWIPDTKRDPNAPPKDGAS